MTRVCTFILALTCGGGTAFAALPITFEENRGQAPPEVLFLSRAAGYRVFLTRQGAVVTLQDGQAVRFRLANSRTKPVGTDLLAAKTNYLLGSDRAAWRSGIANYERVTYSQAYRGIDMTWHARGDEIEHDFRVGPGADPRQIQLLFSGAALRVTSDGDLLAGTLHFHKPRADQDGREVECRYVLRGSTVRFGLGRYDRARPLTIDPVLSFSTFLGNGSPVATTLDAAGNVYVAGNTMALGFPGTADAFQQTPVGDYCAGPFGAGPPIPCYDIFVAKLSGDGKTLLYATYLGGPGDDLVQAIALGPAGKLYFTAMYSTNWIPNLTLLPGQTAGSRDYVAALSTDGSSLAFATVLPVPATALAVDASGAVYLTGEISAGTPPTSVLPTVNAFQQKPADSGLFKTTDHGSHWQTSANGLSPYFDFRFVTADPTNPQVLYAGGGAGLFMTRDGGANWTSLAGGLNLQPNSMAIDPHSPQTLYVSITSAYQIPGVYKSTDGGITWVGAGSGIVSPGLPRVVSLTMDPTNSSVLYAATIVGLFKTTDGAATWKPTGLVITPESGSEVGQIAVDPTNPATVYAATIYGVTKSIDGGATWNAMNTGFAAAGLPVLGLAMDPASPQTLYAGVSPGGNGQYAGIYKTTDGGAHWTPGQWPEPGVTVSFLLVDPELHSRIWAAASTGVFISLDSGATWSRTPLPHLGVASIAEAGDGAVYAGGNGGLGDAFAMKLDATGSNLLYSTYLGGFGRDVPGGIAVDAAGRAYIAGETDSPDFPLAAPLQPAFGGNSDVFVTVLDPSGSHLVWSTYLGGSGAEGASAIALDSAGNVHLAGTVSPTYPFLASGGEAWDATAAGATADAFIAKIKGDGSRLIFSTHLGGTAFENARGVAADAVGNTYVAGTTTSKDLPTVNAVQPALAGGADAYVAAFNGQTGAVQYATYLGGTSDDFARGIAADAVGNAFVAGQTGSQDFPLKNAWQGSFSSYLSNFVAKLAVPISVNGLTNAASYTTTVAPGELVSLFGTNLATGVAPAAALPLTTQLLDAQVMVNGVAAPLVYAAPLQLNAQIPFETQTGTAQVQVMSSAGSGTMTVQVAAAAPAIFTLNQQGTGPGAIQHATTYQVVTDSNPATAGEIVSIYCTGLGAVNPPAQTGAVPPVPPPQTVVPVQVSIGGITVQPLYAGVAPGFPGLYQVNAQIPIGTRSGAQPLQILQNGVASNTVTVAVQ